MSEHTTANDDFFAELADLLERHGVSLRAAIDTSDPYAVSQIYLWFMVNDRSIGCAELPCDVLAIAAAGSRI